MCSLAGWLVVHPSVESVVIVYPVLPHMLDATFSMVGASDYVALALSDRVPLGLVVVEVVGPFLTVRMDHSPSYVIRRSVLASETDVV